MGRFSLILIFGLFVWGAQALTCEPLYRFAYSEFSKRGEPRLSEAARLYLIHFDASNGVSEVYAEARPLFSLLSISPGQEDRVLEILSEKIRDGGLCPRGKTLTVEQAADVLRPLIQN